MAELISGNSVKTIAFYLPQFHCIPEQGFISAAYRGPAPQPESASGKAVSDAPAALQELVRCRGGYERPYS